MDLLFHQYSYRYIHTVMMNMLDSMLTYTLPNNIYYQNHMILMSLYLRKSVVMMMMAIKMKAID